MIVSIFKYVSIQELLFGEINIINGWLLDGNGWFVRPSRSRGNGIDVTAAAGMILRRPAVGNDSASG
jgi:hypothetical protein